MSTELHEALKAAAKQNGVSLNLFMVELLAGGISYKKGPRSGMQTVQIHDQTIHDAALAELIDEARRNGQAKGHSDALHEVNVTLADGHLNIQMEWQAWPAPDGNWTGVKGGVGTMIVPDDAVTLA